MNIQAGCLTPGGCDQAFHHRIVRLALGWSIANCPDIDLENEEQTADFPPAEWHLQWKG
jgi:hypothetical protein